MRKSEKFKSAYDRKKAPNVKDILTDPNWNVEDIEYNEKTGNYDFQVKHSDGREVFVSRNKQYVDQLLDELENE